MLSTLEHLEEIVVVYKFSKLPFFVFIHGFLRWKVLDILKSFTIEFYIKETSLNRFKCNLT